LGDTLGELYFFYALSDIAFVGGSLVPVGGHNLLEPVSLRLPVVTGPYLFNYTAISQLLSKVNTLQIGKNAAAIYEIVNQLLSDEAYCRQIGQRGFEILYNNQG